MYRYRKLIKELSKESFDFIIANELESLHLAFEVKGDAKIIFDAHEFYPDEKSKNKLHMLFFHRTSRYFLDKYASKVDLFCTVTNGLGEGYKKYYGNPLMKVHIITNAREYESNLKPKEAKTPIRCIHHGICAERKNIHSLVEAVIRLPGHVTLTLMLVKNTHKSSVYYERLKKLAEGHNNINFIDPVGYMDICKTLNNYDVGLYMLPSSTFHNKHALPNKFFEFIQSRLAIITGPSIEMQYYVKNYNLGEVTKDFEVDSLVQILLSLNKNKVMEYKMNSHRNSMQLSSDANRNAFLDVINKMS